MTCKYTEQRGGTNPGQPVYVALIVDSRLVDNQFMQHEVVSKSAQVMERHAKTLKSKCADPQMRAGPLGRRPALGRSAP